MSAGWAVRGTSRTEDGLAPIRATGIEPAIADPLWPETVLDLVGDVALLVWALGSARPDGADGEGEVRELHGERLERTLERLVETPVRGFLYEGAGSVDAEALAVGRRAVESAAARWRIPAETIEADPVEHDPWASAMAAAAARLVA